MSESQEGQLIERRQSTRQSDELTNLIYLLRDEITELSKQIKTIKPKVDELTTYLERGKGIFWLLKLSCVVAPVVTSIVAGVYWVVTHLKS